MWGSKPWGDLVDDTDAFLDFFSQYGMAVFESSGLEESLVLLFSIDALAAGLEPGSDSIRAVMASKRERTLGALIREASDSGLIPTETAGRFTAALEDRNRLIHHFHRDVVPHIASPARRDAMIDDLRALTRTFSDLGYEANALMLTRAEAQDIDVRRIEEDTHNFLQSLRDEPAGV